MEIRGERECKNCGTRWSYFDTGSVECPDCGAIRSVGVAERQLHTASPAELDLGDARAALDTEPLGTVARLAAESAAMFLRKTGFIDAGGLQPLTETVVAATELRHVGTELARSLRIDDREKAYLLALLDGAESGSRPEPDAVPASLSPARGLAASAAVEDYRRDLRQFLEANPDEDARRVLGLVEDHRTRIDALDGDVPPASADALVEAARAVGTYLIEPDATLEPARQRLAELDPDSR